MSAGPLEDGIFIARCIEPEGFSHSDSNQYLTHIEIGGCIFLPAQASNDHLSHQPYFYREAAAFAFLVLMSVS